ncbi:MAG: hypothetical protein HC906_17065 [Bacteroidales bacterium]|nr:hypothetical protein [Bacteroidales bacterium]
MISSVRRKVKLLETTIYKLRSENELLKDDNTQCKQKFSALEQEYSNKTNELQLLKNLISEANEELENYRNDLEKLVEERSTSIKQSEEKYRNFIENSSEGIFYIHFKHDINSKLSPDEISEKIINEGYISDCNYTFVRFMGFSVKSDLIGCAIKHFFKEKSTVLSEIDLKNFAVHSFKIIDNLVKTTDENGNKFSYLNNLSGILMNNILIGIWGSLKILPK